MAVRTQEEITNSLRELIGDNTTDEALGLFEDISDTFASMRDDENKHYKELYEQNDKEWRQKYRDRFMSGKPDSDEEDEEPDEKKTYKFESLFKEG